jgi:hypothetical protein
LTRRRGRCHDGCGCFNLGPLVAGIMLIMVAAVFQFGGRLQKDTEGLV